VTDHSFSDSFLTKACAVRSRRASSPDGPTNCTPNGIPLALVISGIVIAGKSRTFYAIYRNIGNLIEDG
jgi:hypothetical protein